MLLRIIFFAFLLLPSYASWYPNAKVSCDPEHEKESQHPVPPKILKTEFQGYVNILLLGSCSLSVLIYLTYSLKRHHPNLGIGVLNDCMHSQDQNTLKKGMQGEDNKDSIQDESINREELTPQPSTENSSETLSPQPEQTETEVTPNEEATAKFHFNGNEPGEIILNSECEVSVPESIPIQHSVDEAMNISETFQDMPILELDRPSTRKETEENQNSSENSKRTRSSEFTTPKSNSTASKCKIPDTKSSPTKGSSGTKLPQKVSKNSLSSPKSAGRTNDATSSSSRAVKTPTETLLKKNARKESNDSVSKEASNPDAQCRCESKLSIDKLSKEIEVLKKRITAAEKGKRDAIRDGDILQKGMTSIKLSLKSMTEENVKLKKELEIAKRDKTESVRRITAKWREKLSQLEEKMRIEVECASNKAESISSNVASNSSKNRPDPEDCPMKPPPHTSRVYRWNFTPDPQETCRRKETQPSSNFNDSEINFGWVDTVRRKSTIERENDEVGEKICEAQHIPSAEFPVRINQEVHEEVADDVTAKPGDTEIPENMIDDHPREDDWVDNGTYSTGNEENCPVLQGITSEATERLGNMRSADVLDDQGNESGYQERGIPASEVDEYVESRFEEGARETGMATQEINAESLTTAEDTIANQDSGIELTSVTTESTKHNSPNAFSVKPKEKVKESAVTEIGQKGGRSLTLRARSKGSNTSAEISIVGKKSCNVEAMHTGSERVRSYSKSNISIGKHGLSPKTSEKICTTKPPVPKSTLHRAVSKNEFDVRSMESSHSIKFTRTTSGGFSAHQMTADHILDISSESKYSSYTKVIDNSAVDGTECKALMGDETTSNKESETKECDPNSQRHEGEDATQEKEESENPITEILHPNSNYWIAFEEENRCNVVDETCHRNQGNVENTQLDVSNVAYGSECVKETEGGVLRERMPEEITEEMSSMHAEQTEIQDSMDGIDLNIPGQSISDMEQEARKYIQDLIALSSSFSEEEKAAVEELLGGSFSGRSLLQNLSTLVSLDADEPNQSATPDQGSIDAGQVATSSETRTGQNSSTAPAVDTSTSADSVASLGQGFLTGKLKQCFVYDPQRLKDHNTNALNNLIHKVVAKKSDETNNNS